MHDLALWHDGWLMNVWFDGLASGLKSGKSVSQRKQPSDLTTGSRENIPPHSLIPIIHDNPLFLLNYRPYPFQ